MGPSVSVCHSLVPGLPLRYSLLQFRTSPVLVDSDRVLSSSPGALYSLAPCRIMGCPQWGQMVLSQELIGPSLNPNVNLNPQ